MIQIARFTFNPIGENTYVLWDESKEAVLIDCGAWFPKEREERLRESTFDTG